MIKVKNKVIFSLTVFFLIAGIGSTMAGSIWPAQSTWDSEWPKLNIIITGGNVKGTCANPGWTIDGKVISDVKITGHWYQTDTQLSGRYIFTIASDGSAFNGLWCYGEGDPSFGNPGWDGTLISSSDNSGGGISYPDISGNWDGFWPGWDKGKPCNIRQNGSELIFTNHVGDVSYGYFIQTGWGEWGEVVATDWSNLHGTLSQGTLSPGLDRIDWSNGSWWVRTSFGDNTPSDDIMIIR